MTATAPEIARNWMRRTGYGLSALVVLFMLMDVTMKLLRLPVVLETSAQIGWRQRALFHSVSSC